MFCQKIAAKVPWQMTERTREASKVTAISLIFASVVFLTIGSALLGIGMSRHFMSMGVGLIPYLVGYFCVVIATGMLLSSVPFWLACISQSCYTETTSL